MAGGWSVRFIRWKWLDKEIRDINILEFFFARALNFYSLTDEEARSREQIRLQGQPSHHQSAQATSPR